MHHRLLVARGHEAHALLVDRLADAREVAVAEDAERAREERRLVAVALDGLHREEAHERLRHRQTYRRHLRAPIGWPLWNVAIDEIDTIASNDGKRDCAPQVAVMGRLCADLYPEQLETPLSEVETYRRFVGGFAGQRRDGARPARRRVHDRLGGRRRRPRRVRAHATSSARASTAAVSAPTRRCARRSRSARRGRPTASRSPSTARRPAPTGSCGSRDLDLEALAGAAARARHRHGPRARAEPHGDARARAGARGARAAHDLRRRLARAAVGCAGGVPGRRGHRGCLVERRRRRRLRARGRRARPGRARRSS